MDVQVQRTFVIPPPPSEPSAEVPPTVFDLVAPAYHVTVLFAYAPPNPTNAALLQALADTLPRFPLLTARRLERPASHPDHRLPFFVTGASGAGALVVEAAVPTPLSDHLPLAPSSPGLARLHPPVDGATPHVLGGVDVFVSLWHKHAEVLRDIAYTID
ncbi:agmatine coumaroyltransferase-2-like [Panicum miliaceum]|uniref:Agmatine coumaroyltransferase-2-like n=1 Tax=Panicum miliaceum TaxID=4540 RepID=A0A3L6T014_PANMI|nr:agmatine coumaroyltransferase-2-like [Panicum miliaceum]